MCLGGRRVWKYPKGLYTKIINSSGTPITFSGHPLLFQHHLGLGPGFENPPGSDWESEGSQWGSLWRAWSCCREMLRPFSCTFPAIRAGCPAPRGFLHHQLPGLLWALLQGRDVVALPHCWSWKRLLVLLWVPGSLSPPDPGRGGEEAADLHGSDLPLHAGPAGIALPGPRENRHHQKLHPRLGHRGWCGAWESPGLSGSSLHTCSTQGCSPQQGRVGQAARGLIPGELGVFSLS